MKLYFFDKQKGHKREDTDTMIRESLKDYVSGHSLPSYNGTIERTLLGKPYINYPLHIGASHTDDTVIIGIDENNFGIDCEKCDRIVERYDSIMKKFFTDAERKYVYESTDRQSAFLDIWVKKEAYVKFTGKGISGMPECDVTILSGFEKINNDKNLIIYIYRE